MVNEKRKNQMKSTKKLNRTALKYEVKTFLITYLLIVKSQKINFLCKKLFQNFNSFVSYLIDII